MTAGVLSFIMVLGALWFVQSRGYLGGRATAQSGAPATPMSRHQVEDDFVRMALDQAKQGHVDEALKGLNVAIAANPGKAYEAYYYRGIIRSEQGDISAGIDDLTKAIKANPHMAEAYAARGSLYLTQDRPSTAVKDFSKAIQLDPKHAANYINRGQAYLSMDMVDLALKDLQKALELAPNSLAAHFNRGWPISRRNRWTRPSPISQSASNWIPMCPLLISTGLWPTLNWIKRRRQQRIWPCSSNCPRMGRDATRPRRYLIL
jgi:Tfp pilus assembly protein PilF